jgi:predicted nucleotidyltransferase component of viral defense system
MSKKRTSNIVASVRQRLLNIINETGDDPNMVWSHYATERLLYRLSVSAYAGDFMLKGALLFMVWTGRLHRPTVDIDLLGHGKASSERLVDVFRKLCRVNVEPDGLVFDPDTVNAEPIREDQEYQGHRVRLVSFLGRARIPIQVDIGFGDVVTPRARKINYPTLLDFPAPRIRACPRETVVAEKLQAIVMLGIANSRMKDFYDLHVLAHSFAFSGPTLTRAIKATFKRRKTEIPSETPMALTEEFGRHGAKVTQWNAFLHKSGIEHGFPGLSSVLSHLRKFLLPPLKGASGKGSIPLRWAKGGPWAFQKSGTEET